jgi:DNA-directed RNA polymerase specialized sigma24 family protein
LDRHPDDVAADDDFTLVEAARRGDRLAFGLLYLRHHAAAWRIACVASRFSPDAELAVIEGFTRVFSALPQEAEEFRTGGVTFRPYVLACVRQAALERARAAGRAERARVGPASPPPPAPLTGLGPDGEVVLSTLEHHVARGALAALPERARTALWLFDVEAMTPAEVAGILGGWPEDAAALADGARAEVHTAQQAGLGRHEVRAGCRFTVEHLDAYRAGTLDPSDGVIVRSHLDSCPPCRMRQGELANAPAALAAAVPAAPLLGGEAQQHWLASAADLRPAERLLPPGVAAAPAHRVPDALRRAGRAAARSWRPRSDAIDLTTRSRLAGASDPTLPPGWTDSPGWSGSPTPSLPPAWTTPPGRAASGAGPDAGAGPYPAAALAARSDRLPALARQAKRTLWPAVPAVSLVAAWLIAMLTLPWLVAPRTAPGPEGLALPAVQAYVPWFLPGAAPARDARPRSGGPAYPPPGAAASGLAAESPGPNAGDHPSVTLIAAVVSGPNRSGRPVHRSGPGPDLLGASHPVATPAVEALPAAPAVVPDTVAATTAPAPATATPAPAHPPVRPSPAPKSGKHDHHGKPETVATVPEQPETTAQRSGRAGRRTTGKQTAPRGKQTAPPAPRTRIVTA